MTTKVSSIGIELRPSSSERWINCPPSLYYSKLEPESSEAAKEGTLLHKVAADALHEFYNPLTYQLIMEPTADFEIAILTAAHANNVELNSIQYNLILGYLTYVSKFTDAESLAFIEHPFVGKLDINNKLIEIHGTPDLVIYTPSAVNTTGNSIHVFDFKTGLIPIRAFENTQLMIYSYLVMDTFGLPYILSHPDPFAKQLTGITNHIVHDNDPRCIDYTSEAWYPSDDILEFINNKVRLAIMNLLNNEATKQEGPWCKYCDGVLLCEKKRESAQQITVHHTEELVDRLPTEDVKELELLLMKYEDLESYFNKIKAHLEGHLCKGNKLHYYELGKKRKVRKWADKDSVAAELANYCKCSPNEFLTTDVVSPAVACKLLKTKDIDYAAALNKVEELIDKSGCEEYVIKRQPNNRQAIMKMNKVLSIP